jgi:hypothetical protein
MLALQATDTQLGIPTLLSKWGLNGLNEARNEACLAGAFNRSVSCPFFTFLPFYPGVVAAYGNLHVAVGVGEAGFAKCF